MCWNGGWDMEDRKDKQKIQQIFDSALSGIQDDPWMAQRILNLAHREGETVVKKKLSVGLILLMIIVMSATAALAWTISRQYFEDVASLQSASGYYDQWCLEDKQTLVALMQKHGLINEEEASSLLTEGAIDAFMTERYGADDALGLWAILETELGPIESWFLEDKAWYSEMQIASGLQTDISDEAVYALPDAADIQPDEAISLARAAIIDAYQLTADALDQHQIEICFQRYPDEAFSDFHYDISFRGNSVADFYACSLTRDGRIMDSSMGELYRSPAESVQDKQQFLLENDLEVSQLFTQYAQEHITGDMYFPFWPLEDKVAVTNMLRPIILENMAEMPGYADQTNLYWVKHIYGLPDDKAISQEQAVALARKQLTLDFGLTEDQAALLDRVGVFYEITDPASPLWKITLRIGENRDAATAAALPLDAHYRVVLNAYTGQVVEAHSLTETDTSTPENIALIY